MELGRGDDRALAQDFARGCTREVVFGGWSANIDASQASQGLAGGRSLPRPRAPVGEGSGGESPTGLIQARGSCASSSSR